MKNRMLLVAALTSLGVSSVFAQSAVTIYGTADVGYAYQNNTSGQHINQVFSGGLTESRIGLKGVEDLGGGNSVFFVLEEGLAIDAPSNDGSGLTSRQTFVGLKNNKFGALSGGRQFSPGYIASNMYDAIYASPLSASQVLANMGGMTIAASANGRWNNSLNYSSPTFYGVSGQFMVRTGDQVASTGTSDGSSQSGFGIGLNYAYNNFNASYVYQSTDSSQSGSNLVLVSAPGTQRENMIGGSYDFKVVKIVGQYQWASWTGTGDANADNQLWTIGAIVPITERFSVATNYGQLRADNDQPNTNGTAQSTSVGGIYSLSKRTKLYGLFNYTTVDNDMRVMSYNGLVSPTTESNTLVSNTANGYSYAFGMNHMF
jgi:predicted porin